MKPTFKQRLLLGSITLALAAPSAFGVTETFNTAGTFNWTAPGGVTSIQVECWGGGGAGGGAQRTSTGNAGGGGGGGGAYAIRTLVPVNPGTQYNFVIPAAAACPTTFTNDARFDGGTVSFTGEGVTVTADGGTGGQCKVATTATILTGGGGAGGTSGSSAGDIVRTGGNGAANASSSGGPGGAGASDLTNGNNATASAAGATTTGSDANHNGGAGGAGRTAENVGLVGTAPGGGGGGGKVTTVTSKIGGAGGVGRTILTYTVPSNFKANNVIALNDPTSWTGGFVPAGSIAEWEGTVLAANTTSLGGDLTFSGIKISNPGGLVTVNSPGGFTLTLGAAAIDLDLTAATQDLTLNSNLALGAANVWDVANGRTVTLGGVISGSSTVTKQGLGTTVLSGASTYTGNTTVTKGTLTISGAGSITGNTTATKLALQPTVSGDSGIANYTSSATSTLFAVVGANVAGTASVLNQSNGLIQISPNQTTDVQSVVGATGAYGAYNISGGTFRDTTGTSGQKRFTLTNVGTASATNGTITGVRVGIVNVSGTGFIDHTNAEWWLNYSLGQINVTDSGKIDHTGSNQPFGIIMNTTVVGGGYGVLNLAGTGAQVITGAQPLRYGNSVTAGAGDGLSAFVNLAAGTLSTGTIGTTLLPAAPTATNYICYNYAGGTLKASAPLPVGWTPTSGASATVTNTLYGAINNSTLLPAAPNFAGGLTVDTNGNAVTIPNTQPLLAASGTGVTQGNLTIGGGSGYIGAPSVTFSRPAAASGVAASGYAILNGGAVAGIVITNPGIYASGETPAINLLGGFAAGAGTAATVTSSPLTTPNTSGGLTKIGAGTLTLSGANTYTGGTVVGEGTLLLSGAVDLPASGALQVNAGATFSLADGTARTTNVASLNLADGSSVALDWDAGVVDTLVSTAAAATSGNVLISLSLFNSPAGTNLTLISSPNGGLLGANYLFANNNGNTVSVSDTAVQISSIGFTPLTSAYWVGGKVTGAPASMSASSATASNWATNVGGTSAASLVPSATTNVFFSATGATQQANVVLSAPMSVNSLTFNDTTPVTIGVGAGNTLTLNSTGVGASSAISANQNATINAGLALGADQTWTVASTKSLNVGGVVSGGFGLSKEGTGTLILAGSNSYLGGTTLAASGGTIQATITQTASGLGTGAVFVGAGSTLVLDDTSTTNVANVPLIGNVFTGSGLLNLQFAAGGSNRNTYLPNVTGFDGAIQLSTPSTTGDKWNAANVGTIPGSLVIGSGTTFYVPSGTSSFTGGITLNGVGNAEGRGAIRIGNATAVVGGNIILSTSSTIGMENVASSLTSDISSGAVGTQTLTLGGTGSLGGVLSGVIGGGTGTIELATAVAGTYTLTNANTYAGGTNVNAGTLNLGNADAIGTGTLTMGGGNLNSAVADLVNTGNNVQAWNSDFAFTGTQSLNLGTGAVTLSANRAVTVTANTLTVGGAIGGGAVGLTKLGAGILALSGSNTYSGPTTITAGTLQIGASDNLGDGSATNTLTLGAATLRSTTGTYDLGINRTIALTANATVRADAGTLTLSGDVTNGASSLALLGPGDIIVNGVIGTGATPTGAITIGSSTAASNVTLSGNNLFTGNVSLPASNTQPLSVLTVTNSGALGVGPKTVTAQGGGQIHLQNGITLPSNINFNVSGTALFNDSGNNTIGGNISMASGNGSTILTSTSGFLTINGNMTATAVTRTLNLRGAGNGLIAGIISNGSTVNLPVLKDIGSGTWTLTNVNTYTGTTTISAGTLVIDDGSIATSSGIVNNAALEYKLNANARSYANVISGTGTLDKTGTNTLTLSGLNTYTGNTTVSAGTLALTPGAQLKFVLGATSGMNNSISGAGTVTLDGDFVIDTTAADALTSGSWTLENVTSLTGAYGSTFSVAGFVDAGGDKWTKAISGGNTYTFNETTGSLTLTPGGYDVWKNQITNGLNLRTDDADGDGFTNLQEFLFGTSPITGNGSLVTTTTSGGNIVLRWLQREAGSTYKVEQSATLAAGSWTTAAQTPALDGNQAGAPTDYDYYTVSIPIGSGSLFYRIDGVEN